MTDNARRDIGGRLELEANRLLGIKYFDGAPDHMMHVDLALSPSTLSCTQFVVVVFRRTFGDLAIKHLGDARSMFREPQAFFLSRLQVEEEAQGGDLIFYTRQGDAMVHPLTGPNGNPEQWHVMMLAGPGQVIGACPVANEVVRVDRIAYLVRGWTERGILRTPLVLRDVGDG